MSSYIASALALLLLIGATLLGLEAFAIFNAARMVDSALADVQPKLAADGGASPAVLALARERIAAQGGDPSRLALTGTRPYAAYGEIVRLEAVYEHPYRLPLLAFGVRSGIFTVRRSAVTASGYQP